MDRTKPMFGLRLTPAIFVLIVVAVVSVRLTIYLVYPSDGPYVSHKSPDGWLDIASHVVSGRGYTLGEYDMPTARRGPTVIAFFAVILWVFGDNLWSIVLAQWIVDIGTAIILFFIAIEIFQDRRVAIVSSMLYALGGSAIIFTFRAWSEPVFTLYLAGFTLVLLRALRQPSLRYFAWCGVMLGITTLARPIMQFYPLVLLPLLLWKMDGPWQKTLLRFAVLCAAFAAVLLPWVVRNYVVFEALIPASSHGGHALYQANFALGQDRYLQYESTDFSRPAFRQLLESHYGPGPDSPDIESYLRAKALDEYEVSRLAFQKGLEAIQKYPGRYMAASFMRFFRLWFGKQFFKMIRGQGSVVAYLFGMANLILIGLATAAFVFWPGRWMSSSVPLIVLLVYSTAIYMATLAITRYSVPCLPYLMVFAAYTLVRLGSSSQVQKVLIICGIATLTMLKSITDINDPNTTVPAITHLPAGVLGTVVACCITEWPPARDALI